MEGTAMHLQSVKAWYPVKGEKNTTRTSYGPTISPFAQIDCGGGWVCSEPISNAKRRLDDKATHRQPGYRLLRQATIIVLEAGMPPNQLPI